MQTFQTVLDFWFAELTPQQWWVKDAELDRLIRNRFGDVHAQAVAGELFAWRSTPQGRLAEVIVLDQFSRNMYRDQPGAFAADAMALVLAQEAVASGDDQALNQDQRSFLYMPYMHSESTRIHEVAVTLFEANGNESNVTFEHRHKDIIDRFGRYPHRNGILGRPSTDEECAFLEQPGSHF